MEMLVQLLNLGSWTFPYGPSESCICFPKKIRHNLIMGANATNYKSIIQKNTGDIDKQT